MSYRIALVVPVFNGEKYLPALLNSIRTQGIASQTILVDNGSTDQCGSHAVAQDTALIAIRQPRNEGFGSACNAGIRRALEDGAEWVFVLNQDLILEQGAIERAVVTAEANSRIGFLGLFQLNYDGSGLDPIFRHYLPPEYGDDLLLRSLQTSYSVSFVPAAAVLLRRDCLLELGAFDPLYYMYLEDRDLCHRLISHGWQVAIATTARVRHDCGQVRAAKSIHWNLNWYLSRTLYHLKSSPRSLPMAYLTALKNLLPRWSVTEAFHWGIAWCRSITVAGKLSKHRLIVPGLGTPSQEHGVTRS